MRPIRDLPLVQKTAFDFKKCHLTCLKSIFQMSGWWTGVSRCLSSRTSSVLGLGCLILFASISSGYRIALQVYFAQDAWFTSYWLQHLLSLRCYLSPRKDTFYMPPPGDWACTLCGHDCTPFWGKSYGGLNNWPYLRPIISEPLEVGPRPKIFGWFFMGTWVREL